jgi:mannose PTS system EIIA component
MPALLIIAHAPLASSLKAVAVHAYPDCARALLALDVTPEMPPDVVEAQARQMLAQTASPQALILTDVFGATPCNVAQRLADDQQIKVVAGVNVPMLWRTLCYADKSLDAMVARALAGATQGVMQVTAAQPRDRLSKAEG